MNELLNFLLVAVIVSGWVLLKDYAKRNYVKNYVGKYTKIKIVAFVIFVLLFIFLSILDCILAI